MKELEAARQDELLRLADVLGKRLGTAVVPRLGKDETEVGVSKSAAATAMAFLDAERDLGSFRKFMEYLPGLDERAAQNPRNPKAEYRVLRDELRRFMEENPELGAEELVYVLSWAVRLINFHRPHDEEAPEAKAGGQKRDDPRPKQKKDGPASGFNVLAHAFGKLKGAGEERG